jgi:hypothetical protein
MPVPQNQDLDASGGASEVTRPRLTSLADDVAHTRPSRRSTTGP